MRFLVASGRWYGMFEFILSGLILPERISLFFQSLPYLQLDSLHRDHNE
jgi:hypothetical protein